MAMTKSQIAERIAALKRSLGEAASEPMPEPEHKPEIILTKSQIAEKIAELKNSLSDTSAEQDEPENPKEGFMHRLGQMGRGLVSAIGRDSDAMPIGNPLYGYPEDYEGVLAKSVPGVQMSEELPRTLGFGQEYEPEAEDTIGQVAKFGGEMLKPNEFLPFGGYGVVGGALGKGAKAVGKAAAKELGIMGAQAAAIKGTPRFTEEGGISGAIEDLAKGVSTGAGLSATSRGASALKNRVISPGQGRLSGVEKSVSDYLIDKVGPENVDGVLKNLREYESSIGYKPLTAEIAENDALAQLYRAQKGIAGTGIDEAQAAGAEKIKAALDGAKRGSDDISHTQEYVRKRTADLEGDVAHQIDGLRSTADTSETGRTLKNTLIEGLKEKKSARRVPTAPLYESLNENFSELNPANALEVLNNTVVKGNIKADFDYIKKQIIPAAKLTEAEIKYKNAYEKILAEMETKNYGKKAIEDFKSSAQAPKSTTPTVAELSRVRADVLNVMLEKFESSGANTRHAMVKKVKDALDRDLQAVPEQRAADALYHELSGPVSEITDNKALKSVTNERFGKPTMSDSRVPGVFINSSAGSVDDARALLKQIHDKPEAMRVVREHLHEKAIASIADPKTGEVSLQRIESFKNKYPGAKILYPDLYNVKLKDLSHATFAVNKFVNKTQAVQKTLERDAFCNSVGGDPKNIMPDTFNKHSTRNMKNLVSEVSQDASGKARRGLQNETIDFFEKSVSNRSKVGKNHALSYDKMRNFVDNHEKALAEVLEPNQMSVIKEVEKISSGQNSANTRGATLKSDTNANIRNALSLSSWSNGLIKASLAKLGMSTPFVKKFVADFAQARLDKKEAVLNRALRDTKYADFLMSTPLKSKKDALEFSENIKKFNNTKYVSPILMGLAQKEQTKEKD